MLPKVNSRVGVILSADKKEVQFLGYGVYVGNEVPDETAIGMLPEMLRQENSPNPKIVLDNGDVVYGCECYWSAEDDIKQFIAKEKRQIVEVRMSDIRAKFNQEEGNLNVQPD